MFHRELKINYGSLDCAAEALACYIQTLTKLQEGLTAAWEALKEGEGEAYEALMTRKVLILGRVEKELEAATDTYELLTSYIEDMTSIISPDIRGNEMVVDRNDIWGNMSTMENEISHLNILDYYVSVNSGSMCTLFPDEETKRKEKRYYNRVESVRSDIIPPYYTRIVSAFEELKSIYENKVKPYENMDDDYAGKAKDNYQKHTDMWEEAWNGVVSFATGIKDLAVGLVKGVWDALAGIAGFVVGIFYTAGAGITWGFCELFSLDTPDWAFDRLWNVQERREAVLEDPMLIIEGLSQGAMDAVEQKGIAYCAGYITGSIIIDIGIAKSAKVLTSKIAAGKTLKVKGGLDAINKLDDLLVDPSKLAGVSGDELYEYLLKSGYDVKPLSKGSYKGIPFEEGGGFKVNWGGDRILQYHPVDASHHGGAYFKISSGETGTIRIDLDGNIIE